jgi:hypothetical protein
MEIGHAIPDNAFALISIRRGVHRLERRRLPITLLTLRDERYRFAGGDHVG